MEEKLQEILKKVDINSMNMDDEIKRIISIYCSQLESLFFTKFDNYCRDKKVIVSQEGIYKLKQFIYEYIYDNIYSLYSNDNKKYINDFRQIGYSTKAQMLREQPDFNQTIVEFNTINKRCTSDSEYYDMMSWLVRRFGDDFGYDFIDEFIQEIKPQFLKSKDIVDEEISSIRTTYSKPIIDSYSGLQQQVVADFKNRMNLNQELDSFAAMKSNLGVSYDEMSAVAKEFLNESAKNINVLNEQVFSALKPNASSDEKKEQLDRLLSFVTEDFTNHFPSYCNNLNKELIPNCTGKVTDPSIHVMDNPEINKEVNEFCKRNKISDPLAVYTKIQNELCAKFGLPNVNSSDNPIALQFYGSYDSYKSITNNYSKKIVVNELGQVQEVIDQNYNQQPQKLSSHDIF